MSARMRSFLERLANFLMEQALDDLFDHFCNGLKCFSIVLAVSVFPLAVPVIENLIWQPTRGLNTSWPLSYFFFVSLLVYFRLSIYCNTLRNKASFKCGVACVLQQYSNVYLRKLADSFKLVMRDMEGSARNKFADDSETAFKMYKDSLQASFTKLRKSDKTYFQHQVHKTEELIGFMADFEAEIDTLYMKCEDQEPMFEIVHLEACLRLKRKVT